MDAVISSFIDDPFRYTMDFDAFQQVWPTPKIDPDFQPEERRERTRPRPLKNVERERLGLPIDKEPDEEEQSPETEFEV